MEVAFNFDTGTMVNWVIAMLLIARVGNRLYVKGLSGLTPLASSVILLLFFSYLFRESFYTGRLFFEFTREHHGWLVVWSQPGTALAAIGSVEVIFDYALKLSREQEENERLRKENKMLREMSYGTYT